MVRSVSRVREMDLWTSAVHPRNVNAASTMFTADSIVEGEDLAQRIRIVQQICAVQLIIVITDALHKSLGIYKKARMREGKASATRHGYKARAK